MDVEREGPPPEGADLQPQPLPQSGGLVSPAQAEGLSGRGESLGPFPVTVESSVPTSRLRRNSQAPSHGSVPLPSIPEEGRSSVRTRSEPEAPPSIDGRREGDEEAPPSKQPRVEQQTVERMEEDSAGTLQRSSAATQAAASSETSREARTSAGPEQRDGILPPLGSESTATSSSMSQEAAMAERHWQELSSQERQDRLRELERLPVSMRPRTTSPDSGMPSSTPSSAWRWSVWNMSLLAAQAQSEVQLESLSPELRAQFEGTDGADAREWEGIIKTNPKAVIVHKGEAARKLREKWPDRIVSSRMVRRLKPQPGVGTPPKPKSRWCVRGHQDPDVASLRIYSPTPPVEVLMLFLQVTASLRFSFAVADIKQAFLQSDPLERSQGPILVEPCSGIPLAKGDIIELGVAVYGSGRCSLRIPTDTLKAPEGTGVREGSLGSLLVGPKRLKRRDPKDDSA